MRVIYVDVDQGMTWTLKPLAVCTCQQLIIVFLNGKQKQTVTLEDPIKVNMVLLATHGDQHPLYTR